MGGVLCPLIGGYVNPIGSAVAVRSKAPTVLSERRLPGPHYLLINDYEGPLRT